MSAAYEALREAAELEAAPRRAPERPLLRVDLSTSSIAAGADLLWEALEAAIAAAGHDVDLVRVGTLGMSWLEPVVRTRARRRGAGLRTARAGRRGGVAGGRAGGRSGRGGGQAG